MKFWYRINKKPRGRWRVKVEFGMAFSDESLQLIRELNVRWNGLGVALVGVGVGEDRVEEMGRQGYIVQKIPIPLYDDPKSGNFKYDIYRGTCGCRFRNNTNPVSSFFYAEWRPGASPDYGDVAACLHQLGEKLVTEWERRVEEAMTSPELGEVTGEVVWRGLQPVDIKQPRRRVRVAK